MRITDISEIIGIRHNKSSEAHRVVPEMEKEPQSKGKYLHAEQWGKDKSQSMNEVLKPQEPKEIGRAEK